MTYKYSTKCHKMFHHCKPAFVPFEVDMVTVRLVWSTPTTISAQSYCFSINMFICRYSYWLHSDHNLCKLKTQGCYWINPILFTIYLVFMSKTYLGVVYFEDVTLICFGIRLSISRTKVTNIWKWAWSNMIL